jgi:hypothetical protein
VLGVGFYIVAFPAVRDRLLPGHLVDEKQKRARANTRSPRRLSLRERRSKSEGDRNRTTTTVDSPVGTLAASRSRRIVAARTQWVRVDRRSLIEREQAGIGIVTRWPLERLAAVNPRSLKRCA